MDLFFYIGSVIILILGFVFSRKDVKDGIIPDKYTQPTIIFAVASYFLLLGFTFKFYLYFTILVILYLFFMYVQRAIHYAGSQLGTGDIKFFLMIYALIPFHVSAFAGIPLLNIMFWSLVLASFMVTFRILYFLILNRVPLFRVMYGSAIDKTTIRLAPLIYLAFIITFAILL